MTLRLNAFGAQVSDIECELPANQPVCETSATREEEPTASGLDEVRESTCGGSNGIRVGLLQPLPQTNAMHATDDQEQALIAGAEKKIIGLELKLREAHDKVDELEAKLSEAAVAIASRIDASLFDCIDSNGDGVIDRQV